MEYLYITSSIASLLSFISSIILLRHKQKTYNFANYSIIMFISLSFIFWLWFYFFPSNPALTKITERINGLYIEGNRSIYIVEDVIEFDKLGTKDVSLPPLKNIPDSTDITFRYIGFSAPYDPIILKLSKDKFKVKIDNIEQIGRWIYRVRGEPLEKINQ